MILILSDNNDTSTNSVIDWLNYYKIKWFRINENDRMPIKSIEYRLYYNPPFLNTVNKS